MNKQLLGYGIGLDSSMPIKNKKAYRGSAQKSPFYVNAICTITTIVIFMVIVSPVIVMVMKAANHAF